MKSIQTQKEKVLRLLQENSKVNSHDLTYIYSIKQGPTRIQELQEEGYTIDTSPMYPNRSVDYILKDSLELPKKLVRYDFQGSVAIPVYE